MLCFGSGSIQEIQEHPIETLRTSYGIILHLFQKVSNFQTVTALQYDKKCVNFAQGLDISQNYLGKPGKKQGTTRKCVGNPGSEFLIQYSLYIFLLCYGAVQEIPNHKHMQSNNFPFALSKSKQIPNSQTQIKKSLEKYQHVKF